MATPKQGNNDEQAGERIEAGMNSGGQAPAALATDTVQEVERLNEQLREREAEIERMREGYLRALADLDNMRKRARQERQEAFGEGIAALALEVLPILDNFERALSAAQSQEEQVEALTEGIMMIRRQLLSVLSKRGIAPIETKGKLFDPAYHEAVHQVRTDEIAEGTVADEIQKGYMLKGRVLRPARVAVAVRPEAPPPPPSALMEEPSPDGR